MNLEQIKQGLFNLPGWHTKRRIVVLESDDWGSIRIPSRQTYDYLLKIGYHIDKKSYGRDALESSGDVASLFEVLSKIKTISGQNPIFTLNFIVANPDFERIRQDYFKNYYYEIFIDTYKRYSNAGNPFNLLKEGESKGIIRPQLHGREHINVPRWLKSLQDGFPETKDLFEHGMCGLPISLTNENRKDFQRALDYDNEDDGSARCSIINDACEIFHSVWTFKSESFIAPNYFWDYSVEECLFRNGIKILQGQRAQIITKLNGPNKVCYHFTGQKNKLDQVYLVRNSYFEPAFDLNKDWVDKCLKEVRSAFFLGKPAIIGTHRVNYIGSIDEANRTRNLKLLQKLLNSIVDQWPDVEFMSSDQLGRLITLGSSNFK